MNAGSRSPKAYPGRDYLDELPDAIPPGRILVHNFAEPSPLGVGQFLARLDEEDPVRIVSESTGPWSIEEGVEKFMVCHCGWASELGVHYEPIRLLDFGEPKYYGNALWGDEIQTTHVDDVGESRFVVSLVMGDLYGEHSSAKSAAEAVWDTIHDKDNNWTFWCVFDRETKEFHMLQQCEIAGEPATST